MEWRDWINLVAAAATVAAAVLAWLAIRQGNKQAKRSADALVRERRIDFELEHLDRMDEAFEKGENVAFTEGTIRRALRGQGTCPTGCDRTLSWGTRSRTSRQSSEASSVMTACGSNCTKRSAPGWRNAATNGRTG